MTIEKTSWIGRKHTEEFIHFQIAQYIKKYHPKVEYQINAKVLLKHPDHTMAILNNYKWWPSFHVADPRGRYHGLYINLISSGSRAFNNACEPSTDRAKAIDQRMKKIADRGYMVVTCKGFTQGITTIQNYLDL